MSARRMAPTSSWGRNCESRAIRAIAEPLPRRAIAAPSLTVHAAGGDKIICRWHDESGDLLTEEFDPREVTLLWSEGTRER